jgi:DNA polymerase-3 subunit chi
MTRIDFYQISKARMSADQLACRLCEKAWQQRQKVLLLACSPVHSNTLDHLLWTDNDESFIPHDNDEQPGLTTPVLVTHDADPRGERELLINLSADIPVYFAQFERVIEVVTDDNREVARGRYSFYQKRGYELKHFTV